MTVVKSINSELEYLYYINEMIFFKVNVNDTYNAAIVGKASSYCINNECILPPVKSILIK